MYKGLSIIRTISLIPVIHSHTHKEPPLNVTNIPFKFCHISFNKFPFNFLIE